MGEESKGRRDGGRQSSGRKGTLELKLNLERWVGMTQGSSGGGCFRKSNQKQAERGAGNSNHPQCGGWEGGGTGEEQERQAAPRAMHGLVVVNGGQVTKASFSWTRTQELRKIKGLD